MTAPLFFDRVQEESTTTGTGSYVLAGAVTGYQSFAVVGDSETCYYCATDVDLNGAAAGDWEVGLGTYSNSGPTLSRDSIQASSNAGSPVSWSPGTRRVALVAPASFFGTTGNVAGPASSTNNHLAAFDGTTGKLLLDSGIATSAISGKQDVSEKNQANGYAGLSGSSKLTGAQQVYGTAANTACEGDDTRLSNARTPTAHAASHQNGGGDEVALATATANAIPKADANGQLVVGWVAKTTTKTDTGSQNDFNVGQSGYNTIVRLNNSSDLTITGLANGVSGQRVTLRSVGAGSVFLQHQNASSSAGNRFVNFLTEGSTPLAAGAGVAEYVYDGSASRWVLVNHSQGKMITRSFSAGDYTASGSMTWTVGSGDFDTYAYEVVGSLLYLAVRLNSTSVGGTLSNALRVALPNNWKCSPSHGNGLFSYVDNNGAPAQGHLSYSDGDTFLSLFRSLSAPNWSASTDATVVSIGCVVSLK